MIHATIHITPAVRWALALLLAALLAGCGSSTATTATTTATATAATTRPAVPQAETDAGTYVRKLGPEARQVSAAIQAIQVEIGTLAGTTDVNQVAHDAQQAHDNLDSIRDDFAYNADDGPLGDAELQVFTATNDLKNSMGSLVAYTGSPSPATLAQFTTQFERAVGEWNDGVRLIWRTARQRSAPTI